MRTAALLAVLSSAAFGQSDRTACSIGLDAENEYRALPSISDLSLSWEERYGPRRALAKKYPADWALQVALQSPLLIHADMGREWDLAIEHYRALPDRTLGELLEAHLLSPVRRTKSREALDRILAQAEDSPWAHLAMLDWAADSRHGDPALAETEFETFRRMCPGDAPVFRHIQTVRDPEKLKHHVEALRDALESKKQRELDQDDLRLLRTAWTFERITYGSERRDEFRRVVRSDLDFLRDHPAWDSATWIFVYSFGYDEMLQDNAALKSLPDEILKHAPKSSSAYAIRKERWQRENPPPAVSPQGHAMSEPEQMYSARYLAFSMALVKDFWGEEPAGFDAGNILRDDHVPPEMVESLADFVLSNAERFRDQSASWPPLQVAVAETYVSRKIRLEQVPALVERGLQQLEYQEKYSRGRDTPENTEPRAGGDSTSDTQRRAREVLIRHALVTGQTERARILLSDFRRQLDESRPSDTHSPLAARWREHEFEYGILARRAGMDVPLDRELLKGTPQEPERYPVARFEAKDLAGKTWRLEDLQGKVTYVAVWNTACGAMCRAGLAGVQQLYEHWKGRSDRAVVAIAMDANAAIAESSVKANGYTFPIIPSIELAEKLSPGGGWPAEWLIDPQGRRLQRRPPRASGDNIRKIEELADRVAVQ